MKNALTTSPVAIVRFINALLGTWQCHVIDFFFHESLKPAYTKGFEKIYRFLKKAKKQFYHNINRKRVGKQTIDSQFDNLKPMVVLRESLKIQLNCLPVLALRLATVGQIIKKKVF